MKGLFTLCLTYLFTIAVAQPNPTLVEFKTGFTLPVDIANAGDGSDRLFIVEKAGYVRIIDKQGNTLIKPFLDIHTFVESSANERGLLGLVFHPDYVNNGYFYVNYTRETDGDTKISRFKVSDSNPDSADVASEKNLLTINQPASNHNAGDLAFGPDGFLYIPLGDGGGATCLPQAGNSFLGKVLRLDVDQNMDVSPYYGIPENNPFINDAGILDEIWAYGLRNPWRFSFDRSTGDMWIADVGQSSLEEVNYIPATSIGGENFGWPKMEGTLCYTTSTCNSIVPAPPVCNSPSFTDPIFTYGRFSSNGGTSISGGYVYRGCEYPVLQGYYIVADYNSDNMWTVSSNGAFNLHVDAGNNIASFGEDEYGELYAANIANGIIYQVTQGSSTACVGCPINRSVESISTDSMVQSAHTVYGSGVVDATVSFKSNNIELKAGFEVLLNAIFSADIDPCDPGN